MVGITPHAQAAQTLFELPNQIVADSEFQRCCRSLADGDAATFDSVWGSSCAILTAALSREFDNLLIVCPDHKSQDNLVDDLESFSKDTIRRFPMFMTGSDASVVVDQEYGDRLRLLKDAVSGSLPKIIVATVPS